MIAAEPNADTMAERTSTRTRPRLPAGVQRLVLTGFMGSGKTTVGALLAERLGWGFLDLDVEIERRCGMSVAGIFAELGEAHFRHQETAALASALGQPRTVIALGGGAAEELGNRLLLEQTPATAVVFLEAPFAVLYERCVAQATERPVLADRNRAELRFESRQREYRRIAGHRLETSNWSADEVAGAVLQALMVSPEA